MEDTTLMAAFVGVLAGTTSAFVTHIFQIRLERKKKEIESRNIFKKELKKEIAIAVQAIMSLIQEISWASWEVQKNGNKSSSMILEQYNINAKQKLSEISKQLAFIAATDLRVYDRLRAIVENVYMLDVQLANSLVDLTEGKIQKAHFSNLKDSIRKIEYRLPLKFADILRSVDQK